MRVYVCLPLTLGRTGAILIKVGTHVTYNPEKNTGYKTILAPLVTRDGGADM